MMSERTPTSVALCVELAPLAAQLTGGAVLPAPTKGTTYRGGTNWHRDSELPVRSIGFMCYLEPLDAGSGALHVRPGSHRPSAIGVDLAHVTAFRSDRSRRSPPTTAPGDVIVFDEHLLHASDGGSFRRQWRVDFVADEFDDSDEVLRTYFAGQHAPGWDGGTTRTATPATAAPGAR